MIPEDAAALRALLGRTWREAFYLVETNYTGGDESGDAVAHHALRVWRNRPEYRFEGRIHEQKSHTMPTYLPERFETSNVRIRHYGYLRSRIAAKDKSRRNIELLELEARENPSPFDDFNLGSEYLVAGRAGPRPRALRPGVGVAAPASSAGRAPATRRCSSRASSPPAAARATSPRPARRSPRAWRLSPTTPTWCSSWRSAPRPRATSPGRRARPALPRDGRRARPLRRHRRLRHLPGDARAGRGRARPRAAGRGREAVPPLARRAPRLRRAGAAAGHADARRGATPAELAAVVPATPERAAAGRDRLLRGGPHRARRAVVPRRARGPARQRRRAHRPRRDAALREPRFAEAAAEAALRAGGLARSPASAAGARLFALAAAGDGRRLDAALAEAEAAGVRTARRSTLYRAWAAALDGRPLPAIVPAAAGRDRARPCSRRCSACRRDRGVRPAARRLDSGSTGSAARHAPSCSPRCTSAAASSSPPPTSGSPIVQHRCRTSPRWRASPRWRSRAACTEDAAVFAAEAVGARSAAPGRARCLCRLPSKRS